MYMGGEVVRAVGQVSKTWLGDHWLWIVLSVLACCWWRWKYPPPSGRNYPESEDSPRKPATSDVLKVNPLANGAVEKEPTQRPLSPRKSDHQPSAVPPNTGILPQSMATGHNSVLTSAPTPCTQTPSTTLALSLCQIHRILKNGVAGQTWESQPCGDVATYVTH